jgi:hypothetical protein
MTNIEYQLSILQGARDGKKIEATYRNMCKYNIIANPKDHIYDFINWEFRIVSEPVYKPYEKVSMDMIERIINVILSGITKTTNI